MSRSGDPIFNNIYSLCAVAVSGGPDSLALLHMLSYQAEVSTEVHALTVDHGLRDGSYDEARQVGEIVSGWPGVTHFILKWDGDKPAARIQEAARAARYDLMSAHCRQYEIRNLYLAHHQDDQAETVLFRLAKGSGLDGLVGMRPETLYHEQLMLHRPLLSTPKQDLIDYCQKNDLPYVNDPTNEDKTQARPRLRAARDALEAEGLTSERLARTAMRLGRAQTALEQYTDQAWQSALESFSPDHVALLWAIFIQQPEDVQFRMLQRALAHLNPGRDYAPRMNRLEALMERLKMSSSVRETFAGVLIDQNMHNGQLCLHLCRESKSAQTQE